MGESAVKHVLPTINRNSIVSQMNKNLIAPSDLSQLVGDMEWLAGLGHSDVIDAVMDNLQEAEYSEEFKTLQLKVVELDNRVSDINDTVTLKSARDYINHNVLER